MLFILEDIELPKAMAEERVCLGVLCANCRQTQKPINVFPDDFEAWQNGEVVQAAFPYLSTSEQEMLISHICPPCWEKMSPKDEDGSFNLF